MVTDWIWQEGGSLLPSCVSTLLSFHFAPASGTYNVSSTRNSTRKLHSQADGGPSWALKNAGNWTTLWGTTPNTFAHCDRDVLAGRSYLS